METKIDNSIAAVDWQQITGKIEQLNQLKTNPNEVNDIVAVVKGLHSLLLHYTVQQNNASNINISKRVAVVMPPVFPEAIAIAIPNLEQEVVSDEIKERGAPKDFGVQDNTIEDQIILGETTVEEPVLGSIAKIKEMEEAPTKLIFTLEEQASSENNTVKENGAPQSETIEEPTIPNIQDTTSSNILDTQETASRSIEVETVKPSVAEAKGNKQFSIWEAYSSNEVPTLAQHGQTQPENTIGTPPQVEQSFNAAAAGGPIKDLRKAISISDRYLFVNSLFRGDESEYERSIKTINNFNVYQEARYWIDRELKVKLGWDDKNPAVKQFDSLVQRRFN